jgi:hypothetical protein
MSDSAHLCCPYCGAYGVERLFLVPARVDSCECASCSARWDEDPVTGEFKGRSGRQSAVGQRPRTA